MLVILLDIFGLPPVLLLLFSHYRISLHKYVAAVISCIFLALSSAQFSYEGIDLLQAFHLIR
jgi:hypothetical protein